MALWVVMHHMALFYRAPDLSPAWQVLYDGALGVDVFFVLSGFVLAQIYADLRMAGLAAFARRRVLRIYPLHLGVLAAIALATALGIVWSAPPAQWWALPQAALLLPAFIGGPAADWNGTTWSLGIELACYAGFPLLVWLTRRSPGAVLTVLAAVAGLVEWRVQAAHAGAFQGWAAVWRGFGGFGFGTVLGLMARRLTLRAPVAVAIEMAGLAGFGLAIAGRWLDLVPVASGVLIVALAADVGPVARLLRHGAAFHLGRISYSVYLLHVPLLIAFLHYAPVVSRPPLDAGFLLEHALYFAALFGLATLTHRYIEQPARRWGRAAGAGG